MLHANKNRLTAVNMPSILLSVCSKLEDAESSTVGMSTSKCNTVICIRVRWCSMHGIHALKINEVAKSPLDKIVSIGSGCLRLEYP